jgi:hypothetical protein
MTIDDFIYQVDKICREDLYRKALVSERDYITQFNSLIRYPNGINSSVNNKVHSQTLPGKIEQLIGCDSIMIFKFRNGYKIGVFEAKYPRYPSVNPSIPYLHWDSNNRFNSQLNRQSLLHLKFPQIVIWEHFINNGISGTATKPFYDKLGSSLILLQDIKSHISTSKWSHKKLKSALASNCLNYKDLILRIISCEYGEPLQLKNNRIEVDSKSIENYKDENVVSNIKLAELREFKIPILNDDNEKVVNEFLEEYGLNNYYLFEIDKEVKTKHNTI